MENMDSCFIDLFSKGNIVFFGIRLEAGYPFDYLSSSSESVTGYTQDDLKHGLFLTDIIHKSDLPDVIAGLESTTGRCYLHEFRLICKSGKIITAQAFFSIYNESMQITGYLTDISANAESESRLETILSTLPGGVIELDTECRILSANKAIQEIYGYKPEELKGRSLAILMDEQSGRFVVNNLQLAAQTEALPTKFTHRHHKKDGSVIHVEFAWSYVRDGKERIKGFICSITDVTDKKLAHDALSKQLNFLHHILESISHPFFVINVKTMEVVIANSASGYRTGVKCHELLRKSNYPCFMEDFECPLHTVKKTKQPFSCVHIHFDSDNQRKYYEIHGQPVFNEKGELVQMIEYALDITDRKRSESELEKYRNHLEILVDKRTDELNKVNMQLMNEIDERIEKERQLLLAASVIENTIEGITVTDCFGTIQKVNPAFTEITGYEPEEVIGKTPRILKSDKHDEDFYKIMWGNLITKGTWSGEIWNRRKNGDAYPEWLSINAIRDEFGNITHFVAVFHDISEVKQGEEKLKYQAHHDTLTGLPNRQLFNDRLEMAIAFAKRHNQRVAVIFIDLDNFKNVNDTMGHHVGDILLQKVADILKKCVRQEDTVARLGGDEFMLILQDILTEANAVETARRILAEFARPISVGGNEFFINASLGITMYPDDGEDVLTMVKNADLAMYRVKETGKNGYQLFTKNMNEKVQTRVSLERELRRAVQQGEFDLVYQPKVSLSTGRVTGAEALIRWNKDGRIVSPQDFIPVAEETGHIIAIGRFVLNKACEDAVKWHKLGFKDLDVAVNLSARQFRDENLIDSVCGIIDSTGIDPRLLGLEITENTMMEDIQTTIIALAHLVQRGVKISIDDFGTGYSSLSYLKKFPIHVLKVDRQFIKDIPDDTDDIAISTAIINLAKGLNLQVVAEGVETQEQLDFCREHGCDGIQGYFFSRPLSCDAFMELLLSGRTLYQ
ncbi:PAS domain S-box-containing protein/diguanylate cyclase (GGDEF)-like protein [Seleniivibrio woodruffii]|uniref:PAS domain S-box-containing protein/diguanylate cyclase (GGDEF)-like protein n=2 Tax=Seleniivibrio woodruffii TaxID=1078050 RepID=A0A4R1KEZ5_9BACT|nr:EAL domain-containing protein [Seleniivibrio woodruffii]TCK61859.1 PAS domain S-box-containing protein/diguanylate cyclase (GGDEF)-like protein [Seleniivibrio woodruffii]TVZ35026.1 PAS domain S-box-containing protein/diguanylate cyclase (GGDEF)-like protein [Seleniivibrio woodruffii]